MTKIDRAIVTHLSNVSNFLPLVTSSEPMRDRAIDPYPHAAPHGATDGSTHRADERPSDRPPTHAHPPMEPPMVALTDVIVESLPPSGGRRAADPSTCASIGGSSCSRRLNSQVHWGVVVQLTSQLVGPSEGLRAADPATRDSIGGSFVRLTSQLVGGPRAVATCK